MIHLKFLFCLLITPLLILSSCSDDENEEYDLSEAVECTVSGILQYSDAENIWRITYVPDGTIDELQIYYVRDYPIEYSQHEQYSVEAKGLRFPYVDGEAQPAGTLKYNLKVESLNIIEP